MAEIGMLQMLSLAATAASTVMSLASSDDQPQEDYEAAERNAQLAESRASQMDNEAIRQEAKSQREAREERRRGRLAASSALAAGAAGGAGAYGFVGFEDNMGELLAQGEYNALTKLYEGDVAARDLRDDADMEVFNASELRRGGALAYNAGKKKETDRKRGALISGISSAASIGSRLPTASSPSSSRIPSISTDARGPR